MDNVSPAPARLQTLIDAHFPGGAIAKHVREEILIYVIEAQNNRPILQPRCSQGEQDRLT